MGELSSDPVPHVLLRYAILVVAIPCRYQQLALEQRVYMVAFFIGSLGGHEYPTRSQLPGGKRRNDVLVTVGKGYDDVISLLNVSIIEMAGDLLDRLEQLSTRQRPFRSVAGDIDESRLVPPLFGKLLKLFRKSNPVNRYAVTSIHRVTHLLLQQQALPVSSCALNGADARLSSARPLLVLSSYR